LSVRAYLSNLSPRWPFERQEAEHAAHTPGWPDVSTYRDRLSVRKRIAHQPASLKERTSLLKPSSRGSGEAIYVASLAVLAIGAEDFMAVCAAASGRSAAIVAHETETRIEPGAGADALHAALAAFLDSKRRSNSMGERWKPGAAASAQKRMEDAKRRAELIREDWGKREIPTRVLLERAGRKIGRRRDLVPMSYQTAAALLGKRPAAQKKHETDVFREQRRLEALARRKAERGEDI
jgi:hypothetical protein